MQLQLLYPSIRRAGWVILLLSLGSAALLLYDWYFRYFTESAQFLTPTIILLLALISVTLYYKTRRREQLHNDYGTLSFGIGLGALGLSWLGHWSTLIVSTTILRGEAGEVVNLTNYDVAFYADRYAAFLALVLFVNTLLSFFVPTNRSRQLPIAWLTPLTIAVICLNLWLLAYINDASPVDRLISYIVWLLYVVAWTIIGVIGARWLTSFRAIRSEARP